MRLFMRTVYFFSKSYLFNFCLLLLTPLLFTVNCSLLKFTQPKKEFHIYLLAGQSNMAGRGKIEQQDTTAHPNVYVLNKNNQWQLAIDPLHFDKPKIVGVGPGLTFGKIMADYKKGIKIGLVPCAVGGSPIDSWTEGGYHIQTKSYPYDDAVSRTKIAIKDGTIKGILWHQGESDSKPERLRNHPKKLIELINKFRQEFDDSNLPFVLGMLGDFYLIKNKHAREMNNILENIPNKIKNTACVEVSGFTHNGDNTHFGSKSARKLGKRYAEAMIKLEK